MIHGIINVHKEKGFTSHDVVAKLRGITKQKKIGHTGTLDPDATGVLPVCFGKATKVCDLLTNKEKQYEAVLLLGQETDTQDTSGTVIQTGDCSNLTENIVVDAIHSFVGVYEQTPPMYSALKVNGKKLYELAREGIVVERKARQVEIIEIQILEIALPRVRFLVTCSKGTYIRTLCHDIGLKLGCYGCMEQLIRTKVDCFLLADSYRLSEIETMMKEKENLDEILYTIDSLFEQYPAVYVKSEFEKKARNGNPLLIEEVECSTNSFKELEHEQKIRVYIQDEFIGIYLYTKGKRLLKLVKMFATS